MSEKTYNCVCGKTFNNPQKFNGHKTHCKEHLISCGKYENRLEQQKKFIAAGNLVSRKQHDEAKLNKQLQLEKWISENHTCEKCGKVMTEKFASGRFCSRSCANGRSHSEETITKISDKLNSNKSDLRSNYIPIVCKSCEEELPYKFRKRKICPYCYNYVDGKQRKFDLALVKSKNSNALIPELKNELPTIEKEHLSKGYFPRNRMSYAEQFWKKVLDNNHVEYKHDYKVLNRSKTAVYRLDFLIGDVDLEIDGEEHESCLYKDIVRTIYLEEQGYKCYRIKWVNPVNDLNKMIVNNQIEDLFNFLNLPRIC